MVLICNPPAKSMMVKAKSWDLERGNCWRRMPVGVRLALYIRGCDHWSWQWWRAEQHKMRSQLASQFMPFFRLIARILTFRDKKYRILTFCDKTELYLTVLQQNNVEACLRCEASLSLALSGLLSCSLWLPLARSCSLRLPIALRICVQHPRSAHKALAQLAAALLRCNTFCCSEEKDE